MKIRGKIISNYSGFEQVHCSRFSVTQTFNSLILATESRFHRKIEKRIHGVIKSSTVEFYPNARIINSQVYFSYINSLNLFLWALYSVAHYFFRVFCQVNLYLMLYKNSVKII